MSLIKQSEGRPSRLRQSKSGQSGDGQSGNRQIDQIVYILCHSLITLKN